MSTLDLLSNGSIADFDGNALLVKAASVLEEKVSRINGISPELKSGFGALLAAFKDETTTDAAKQKIISILEEKLEEEIEEIKERVIEYIEKAGIKVPENWEHFRKDVKNFRSSPAAIDWELFDLNGSNDLVKTDNHNFALSGSATAELNFGAGVPLPDRIGKALSSQQISEKDVISIGASGSLEGKLAQSIPLISMESKADRSLDLDYYFKASPDEKFGIAVARALDDVVSPFDLSAIQSSKSLLAVRYQNKYGFKFGTNFKLEKGFDFLNSDVGLTVSIAANVLRNGGTEITAWNKGNRVIVAIERNNKNTETTTIGLKAGIDLSALITRVNTILKEVQGEYKAVLTKFDKFTSPGKLVKEKLNEAWKNSDSLNDEEKSLVLSLIGFDAGTSAEESLTNFLEAKVLTHKNSLDEDVDEVAERIANEVFTALGINHSAEAQLKGKIKEALDKGLDKVQEELNETIKQFVASDLSQRTLDALEKQGAKISNLPANVDARVKRLSKPIRNTLQKYFEVLGKIVEATNDTNKAKLELALAMEEVNTDGDKIDLIVEFSKFEQQHNHAFKELIRGSFDAVHTLLTDEGIDGVKASGKLMSFLQSKTTSSMQISFLGFDLGSTSIVDVATELEIDTNAADGGISVTSKSQLEKYYDPALVDEVRKLRFTSLMTLAASAQNPALTNVFRLWHEDKELKRSEVRGFLKGLDGADLFEPSTYLNVLGEFDDYTEANGDTTPEGTLTVGFDLKLKHLKSLLKLDKTRPQFNAQEKQYKDVIAKNLASLGMTPSERADIVKTLKKFVKVGGKPFAHDINIHDPKATIAPATSAILMMNEDLYEVFESLRTADPINRKHFRQAEKAYRHHTLIDAYWHTLLIMRDVYSRAQKLNKNSKRNEELKYFNQKQSELAFHLSRWLKVNKGLFGIPDEVRPETIAYVRAQMDLISGAPKLFAQISFS